MAIRVVFMGTPDFSVPVLKGLIENYQVVGVVSQPDRKVGRHQEVEWAIWYVSQISSAVWACRK